jgi:DNA-binding NtrC family response regulator
MQTVRTIKGAKRPLAQDLQEHVDMIEKLPESSEINVLVSDADWAWPEAVRTIFMPRGINALLATEANDVLDIIEQRRIHTAIVDMDSRRLSGLGTIKMIRAHYPLLPCILVARVTERELLSDALELDVFSVITKPVDMDVLLGQLNKLFIKRYNSNVFAR